MFPDLIPPPDRPLFIDGEFRSILSATLTQFISTEEWDHTSRSWLYGREHLSVQYVLEIKVDEESGDDGAAMPDIRVRVTDLPTPRLSHLAGGRLDLLGMSEGWFGNDAPELHDIEVGVLAVPQHDRIRLRVDATYPNPDARSTQPFVFLGEATLEPVATRVKEIGHLPGFLAHVFGPEWLQSVREVDGGEFSVPGAEQPDRRLWHRRTYIPV